MKRTNLLALLLTAALLLCSFSFPAMAEEPVELTFLLYCNSNFYPEMDEPVTKYIEEKFNVKFNFIIPAITSYEEKMQTVLIGADDLPDLMVFTGVNSKFTMAIEDDMLMDLTDLVKDKENINKYINDKLMTACSKDGRLYGIARGTINRHDGLYIRKDWLDKLGITVDPAGMTKDEFKELLRAFTEDDPDGNNVNDTYGLTYWGAGYPDSPVSTAFGLCGWQPDGNGSFYNTELNLTDDNYVDSLVYYGELYQAGYVVPDSLIQGSSEAGQQFYQGIAGVFGGYAGGFSGTLNNLLAINPEAELTYCAGIKDDNGELSGPGFSAGGMWTLSGISADTKHADLILDIMDWMLSDEGNDIMIHGLEGVHYNTVDGVRVYTDKYAEYNGHKGYWPNIVRRQEPENFIAANLEPEMLEKILGYLNLTVNTVKANYNIGFTNDTITELSNSLMNYGTEMGELRLNIIRGEATKDDWKDFLQRYYDAGYAEIEKQIIELLEAAYN